MIYQRSIFPQLESELGKKENTIITGMRQVGKTVTLEHLYSLLSTRNKVILDLSNPLYRKIFEEENFDAIWNNLRPFGIRKEEQAYIFLDEVQNLPIISEVVKYLSDHYPVKFILTGSSSYYLKNLFPQSMAGRKILFQMYPLTFSEFLAFKEVQRDTQSTFSQKVEAKNRIAYEKLLPYLQEYTLFGGFPRVVLEPDLSRKKAILIDIFTSYFELDVKSLADFKDLSKLRDCILLLVPRVGSRIEIAKLASSLSVSRETVYSYLSFLEHTYFISLLSKFSGSVDRQAAGSQKLYLCDSGIANALGKTSEGQLFEQTVFQSLKPDHTLSFFSKGGEHEIDFIADGNTALEVKISPSKRDIATLKKRVTNLKLPEYYMITKEYSKEREVVLATAL